VCVRIEKNHVSVRCGVYEKEGRKMKTFRAVCLLTALFVAAASSGDAQTIPGGLAYGRNKQGSITITKYTGAAATPVIPDQIQG
jgi:hypothetical protein